MNAAARAPDPPPVLWLVASVSMHLALTLLWFRGDGRGSPEVGERGAAGAGDTTDAIEVALLVTEPASAPDSPAPAASAAVGIPAPRERAAAESAWPARARAASSRSTGADGVSREASGTAGPAVGVELEPPQSDPALGSGSRTEGSESPPDATDRSGAAALILGSTGRLSGESVRASALLGESLACDDPIAGVWVAHRYSPEYRDWARFTLRINRDGTSLDGTIVARMWRGLASDRRPPACTAEGWDYTVTMRATGNLLGDRMAFGASTHEVTRIDCASRFFSYNPDHFSGRVDPLADRMLTVNNDGGRDVDAPYEFHRTGCR